MIKPSTVESPQPTKVKKPRAPRKKAVARTESDAPEPATHTPESGGLFLKKVDEDHSMLTILGKDGESAKVAIYHFKGVPTTPGQMLQVEMKEDFVFPEGLELSERQQKALVEQVQTQIERGLYSQVSESQPIMNISNSAVADEMSDVLKARTDKLVVQGLLGDPHFGCPPVLTLHSGTRFSPPVFTNLGDYVLEKESRPGQILYIGEADRVRREEAETLAEALAGTFVPVQEPSRVHRFQVLPSERKKIIIALGVGVLCLLGLVALATLVFFGEAG
jgi:hypothetical protein